MNIISRITALASQQPNIAALWLYGSRARGDHHDQSDFDLAIAFTDWEADPLERRLRPEMLAEQWRMELELPEGMLSVVDIAIAPTPLGFAILSDGRLLMDSHPQIRMSHESRILSRWELDYEATRGVMNYSVNAYTTAQRQHLSECEQDLETLRAVLESRSWNRIERSAAERTLQVLIESCIGIAKHWAKQSTGRLFPEPRKAVDALREQGLIDASIPWNKVIGLRNVLVHDYLDVDVEVLESVIRALHYKPLIEFARQGLDALA